jgi:hypothetical protein
VRPGAVRGPGDGLVAQDVRELLRSKAADEYRIFHGPIVLVRHRRTECVLRSHQGGLPCPRCCRCPHGGCSCAWPAPIVGVLFDG